MVGNSLYALGMLYSHDPELNICFTDPDYQRRGIGAMILDWGVKLGDQLFLPMWIHASPAGKILYSKFGFIEIDKSRGGALMHRPVRSDPIRGGK